MYFLHSTAWKIAVTLHLIELEYSCWVRLGFSEMSVIRFDIDEPLTCQNRIYEALVDPVETLYFSYYSWQ
jgi:hypothetical protein